jgi:hypothetical protein
VKLQHGSKETTKILDNDGSTEVTTIHLKDGDKVGRERVRFNLRTRVHSTKEELEHYLHFSDDIHAKKNMKDPEFRIEFTKNGDEHGYWFIVKCWTEVR